MKKVHVKLCSKSLTCSIGSIKHIKPCQHFEHLNLLNLSNVTKNMNNKLIEGVDFYYNEDGFMVLTEKYHLDKGYCCGNGCKHCPYHYEAVPEPHKSRLINIKKDE